MTALVPGAVYYSLGQMEQAKRNWKKANDHYEAGLGFLSHDMAYLADMYFGLAYNEWQWMTTLKAGPEREEHKQATLRWLEVMVRVAPEYPAGREQAVWLYEALGRGDLEVEHRVWLAERYVQPGIDLDKGRAIEHRDWLAGQPAG